jgi:hypothetical protein
MNTSLSLIILVVGAVASLFTLIFLIISLARKKNTVRGWLLAFGISLLITVFSFTQFVSGITDSLKNAAQKIEVQKNSNDSLVLREKSNFLDTLRKYTNEKYAVSELYQGYMNGNSRDSIINLPFVFPFSINYTTKSGIGNLIRDTNDSICLINISQMAFDENFMIAKIKIPENQKAESSSLIGEYILFDLRTREYLDFPTLEILKDKSEKIGYTGPRDMQDLSVIYKGWLH